MRWASAFPNSLCKLLLQNKKKGGQDRWNLSLHGKKLLGNCGAHFQGVAPFIGPLSLSWGFCTRQDSMGGVSSFIRCVGTRSSYYQRLIDFFHSNAIDLKKLTELWVKVVFKTFHLGLKAIPGTICHQTRFLGQGITCY